MASHNRQETNYYCEYCNAWMANHPSVRANHDRGAKHKTMVEKRLSEMRKRSDREQKEKASTEQALAEIEHIARRQYLADKAEEEAHRHVNATHTTTTTISNETENIVSINPGWEFQKDSGYFYNAEHRWYYDAHSKMYYGGEDWTLTPKIPREALYKVVEPMIVHKNIAAKTITTTAPSSFSSQQAQQLKQQPSSSTAFAAQYSTGARPGMKIANVQHPLAGVGGYQMPEVGRIGGAKGQGLLHHQGATATKATTTKATTFAAVSEKRKRTEDSKLPPMTKEEEEFIARREAARRRVQKRSMQTFGLG